MLCWGNLFIHIIIVTIIIIIIIIKIPLESKTRTYHGGGGAGQHTAAGRSGAGRGWAGRGGAGRAGRGGTAAGRCAQPTTIHLPSKAPKTTPLDVSSEARTHEILCKTNRGVQRAVDNRFISGPTAALCSRLLTNGPMPFSLCNPL